MCLTFSARIVVINLLNREYSVPESGYDWVAFGILESPEGYPSDRYSLQVDFTPFRLWPKGKNTTSSILLVRSNSSHGSISGGKLFGQRI